MIPIYLFGLCFLIILNARGLDVVYLEREVDVYPSLLLMLFEKIQVCCLYSIGLINVFGRFTRCSVSYGHI